MAKFSVFSIVAISLVVTGGALTAFSANPCVGNGQVGQAMTCVGTCSPGPCTHQNGTGPGGLGGWKYCGCAGGSQYTCCHLLYRAIIDSPPEYDVGGDCISCSLNGTCRRGGSGIAGEPYSAVCALP